MTSIVLIIIGLLLAAASVLMMVFYGGESFNTGSAKAQANTLENAGLGVLSAARMHLAEKDLVPSDIDTLVSSDFLSGKPKLEGIGQPSDQWRLLGADQNGANGKPAYVVDGISKEVCLAVLSAQAPVSTIPSSPDSAVFGCFQDAAEAPIVFYQFMPWSAASSPAPAPVDPAPETPEVPEEPNTTIPAPPAPSASAAEKAVYVRQVGAAMTVAGQNFFIDFNRPPTSDADLVPAYIAAVPRTPYASPESWSYYSVGDRALYQMSITDPELCKAINYASNSFGYAIIPGFQERSVDEGCYQNNSLGLIYLKWYSIRR